MTENETTIPRGKTASVPLSQIAPPHVGANGKVVDRLRQPDREAVKELADSIARQGLLQPIGLQEPTEPGSLGPAGRYRIIWGYGRYLANFHLHQKAIDPDNAGGATQWSNIQAVVYPADLPPQWLTILEIEENLRRKELTAEEKAEHTIRLAAAIKELDNPESRNGSDFSNVDHDQPRPTTGRGHKGMVQKVAEQVNVDHGTVRHRARKASKAIGETVDLDKDSPTELRRKADKLKAMSRAYEADKKASRKKAHEAHRPSKGPSLLDAIGKLVAFTPASARHYLAEHPDDAARIKGLVEPAGAVLMAIGWHPQPVEQQTETRVIRAEPEEPIRLHISTADPTRGISPRTGKPLRTYTRRSAS